MGGFNGAVIELNRHAIAHMHCQTELVIILGAAHLFEEPGTLEEVARQAAVWFGHYFKSPAS